ncbi:MAG TPA: STAS/SEC14 domain-containing protein [Bryobacteraceae bacterium]|nr:STAS/SEC14 domain-containing protein [Bryobacteraceae bacterium]
MPILLRRDESGKFLIIHATGKLVEADYRDLEPQFERLAPHNPKIRVLFDMTGLHGWDAAAAWEDIKFDIRHFRDIERLAIVGEKPWQHGLATLFSPFTRAATKYFDAGKRAAAVDWLQAA